MAGKKTKAVEASKGTKVQAVVLTFRYVHALMQLLDRPMHGVNSKLRNRFVKLLQPVIFDYEAARKENQKKFAVIDKKTGKEILDANGKPEVTSEKDYQAGWQKVGDRSVMIEITPQNKDAVYFVREYLKKKYVEYVENHIPSKKLEEADLVDYPTNKVGDIVKINDPDTGQPEPQFDFDEEEYVEMLEDFIDRFDEGIKNETD